ncbi:ABC transporter permease subunit [Caldiplasma sukawensis]
MTFFSDIILIILATVATTVRVFFLILLSILSGFILAYASIKNRYFENIFISLSEVFESVPVISFFPIVLIIFVSNIGGPLGVELAADFLVFTAVVWNIWLAEYQAFKTIPPDYAEVGENYNFSLWKKLRYIYIPFSLPRIAANIFPSFADAFFYITVSEVFSVGANTYETFGIGYVLTLFYGNLTLEYTTLLILSIIIIASVLILREITERIAAKYTLDTDPQIKRRGKTRIRIASRLSSLSNINPLERLATYNKQRERMVDVQMEALQGRESKSYVFKVAGIISLAVLIYLIYSSVKLIMSVSTGEWNYLLSKTPFLLYSLGIDYIRVAVITLISFVIAVFAGYKLATGKYAEKIGIPLIEVLSAYPAPVYFPFLFIGILPFVISIFGTFTYEIFVLFLGFISTFYYILYSFWMGVKAMPKDYNEVMKNLNMNFWQKLRYVILPSTFPYIVAGLSSTINSAWGGLVIGEYWPDIAGGKTLQVHTGLMKVLDVATDSGNIALAAWASFLFGIVVVIFSILFTRRMMELARKKFVAEEGIYSF